MSDLERFLSVKDLAVLFGVHRTTIHIWRKEGLPHYKIKGRIFFQETEVKDWIEKHKQQKTI